MGNPHKYEVVFHCKALGGVMKKKDAGAIHKLFAMILLLWVVVCWGVLLEVMRAGYASRYLEDSLLQANLAALLIDPYHYGSTGELVFQDASRTKQIFSDYLEDGLGSEEVRQKLGVNGEPEIIDFRIYEVTSMGTTEFDYDENNHYVQRLFGKEAMVTAPDGTIIQNSSIYAKVAVPMTFLFGIEINAIKEHCVDIVSEEMDYE